MKTPTGNNGRYMILWNLVYVAPASCDDPLKDVPAPPQSMDGGEDGLALTSDFFSHWKKTILTPSPTTAYSRCPYRIRSLCLVAGDTIECHQAAEQSWIVWMSELVELQSVKNSVELEDLRGSHWPRHGLPESSGRIAPGARTCSIKW